MQQIGTFSALSPGNHTSTRSASGTTRLDMGLGANDEEEEEEEEEEDEDHEGDNHSRAGLESASDDGSQV